MPFSLGMECINDNNYYDRTQNQKRLGQRTCTEFYTIYSDLSPHGGAPEYPTDAGAGWSRIDPIFSNSHAF